MCCCLIYHRSETSPSLEENTNTEMPGKVMDRDYHLVAKVHGLTVDKVKGDDLSKLPLEEARLRSIWYPIAIAVITLAGYGWALHVKAVSAPGWPLNSKQREES